MAVVLVFVSGLYGALSLYEWNLIYVKSRPLASRLPHYEFSYLIRPAIGCLVLMASLAGYLLNYKAYGVIKTAFENGDHILFNQGFKNIYYAFLLSIIAFATMILTILVQHILF